MLRRTGVVVVEKSKKEEKEERIEKSKQEEKEAEKNRNDVLFAELQQNILNREQIFNMFGEGGFFLGTQSYQNPEVAVIVGGIDVLNDDYGKDSIKIWIGGEKFLLQNDKKLKSFLRRQYAACCKLGNHIGFFVCGGYSFLDTEGALTECERFIFNKQFNRIEVKVDHMINPRYQHTCNLMTTGNILIIGGRSDTNPPNKSAVISPNEMGFISGRDIKFRHFPFSIIPRFGHTSVLTRNGFLYVFGGKMSNNNDVLTVEKVQTREHKPKFEQINATMPNARSEHTAVYLKNNKILLIGGDSNPYTTDLFDVETETFEEGPRLLYPRANHFSFILDDGNVLIGGGDRFENDEKMSDMFKYQIYVTESNEIMEGDAYGKLDEKIVGSAFTRF